MWKFPLLPVALVTMPLSAYCADITAVGFTAGVSESCSGVVNGQAFLTSTFDFYYNGGKVILSASSDGTGSVSVQEKITLHISNTAGSSKWSYDFPSQGWELDPVDLQRKFKPGFNRVSATLNAIKGGCVSATPLWLSNQP